MAPRLCGGGHVSSVIGKAASPRANYKSRGWYRWAARNRTDQFFYIVGLAISRRNDRTAEVVKASRNQKALPGKKRGDPFPTHSGRHTRRSRENVQGFASEPGGRFPAALFVLVRRLSQDSGKKAQDQGLYRRLLTIVRRYSVFAK